MRVVVVTGPRQAGKSTFVEHHPDLVDRPYLLLDRGCATAEFAITLPHLSAANSAKLPAMTIHRYLNLLETSYQIIRLQPYSVNRTKRLIKTPKLYWNDTALALHLGYGGADAQPTGAHFENLVLCDLLAWRDLQTPRAEVTYWRTASGHEVDFVIEWGRQLVGVEVKANTQPTLRDVQGMRTFLAEHPKTARGGVVLHGGKDAYWLDDKIVAVPWWRVL